MPEGFTMPGGGTAGPVHNDPQRKPAPDAAGPRGYTWNRQTRAWQAKVKGQILFKPNTQADEAPAAAAAEMPQGDPEPGWFRDDAEPQAAAGKKRFTIDDVPREVQDQLAGVIGLAGTVMLPLVQAIDPFCGGQLAMNFQQIAEATVPLMCRSERVIKFMTATGGGFMDWISLGMALAPVASAVVRHHITRTVEVVRDVNTGQVHFVEVKRGESEHGDHLTPPQPQMQYAA